MVTFMEGEKVLLQAPANSEFGKGTLTLTNQRIIFERQKGFMSKKAEILVDLLHATILNARVDHVGQLLFEADITHLSPVILGVKAYSTGQISFKVDNPQKWVTEFESAR